MLSLMCVESFITIGRLGGALAVNDFGHFVRNLMRFYASFSAPWKLIININKTENIKYNRSW